MIEYAEADKALVAAAIQYLESMCPAVSDALAIVTWED